MTTSPQDLRLGHAYMHACTPLYLLSRQQSSNAMAKVKNVPHDRQHNNLHRPDNVEKCVKFVVVVVGVVVKKTTGDRPRRKSL